MSEKPEPVAAWSEDKIALIRFFLAAVAVASAVILIVGFPWQK